ncbi:MAG TPA: hypothetical protein VLH16_00450, partial [Bacteroidales bacterium]|nr:hypothetical protein [Bacteroidales bacterium]
MTLIILIAISIAGIIGLSILYYRRIHLLMISIFYGKYSINYYNKFRSYYYRSPFPSIVKDDLYTQIHDFTENQNILHITTSREIKFSDVPFSTSFKALLRKKGTPNYYTALEVADSVIDIPAYKDSAYKYNLRVLYFFWNRTFFMGAFEFRE